MRKLTLILLLLPVFSFSQNRYVSNSGSDAANGLTPGTAWKTMVKVRSAHQTGAQIHAGDTIFFERNSQFTVQDAFNGCTIWGSPTGNAVSGAAGSPIVWDAYGTGDAPNFLFPHPATTDSTSRRCLSFEGVQYYVIRNLQCNDTRYPNDKLGAAWTSGFIQFGEQGSGQEAYHCKAENLYMNNIGLGVIAIGGYDSVINCTMVNFGNVYAQTSLSYGANGITFTGNRHYFARNYIEDAFAMSAVFGLNGGSFEQYNNTDSCVIEYNTCVRTADICEFGGANNTHCINDTFRYNKFINCGNISYINVTGQATGVSNICFFNNDIIENDSSWYSNSPNFGVPFHNYPTWPTLPGKETHLFQASATAAAATMFNLQNNIIYNTNNMDVSNVNQSKIVHLSNLAFLKGGSSFGYTPNGTELNTSSKVFGDTTNTNPSLWDVRMPQSFISAQTLPGKDWDGKSSPILTGAYYTLYSPDCVGCVILPKVINGKNVGKFQ